MSNENSSKGGTDDTNSYGEIHSFRELFDPTTYCTCISHSVELVDNYERRLGIIREAVTMAYL